MTDITAATGTPQVEPAFTSERFEMRPWRRDDVALLHPILGDPRVVFWDEKAGSIEHSADVLERIIRGSDNDRDGLGWFAVVERASGETVGNVVLRTPPFESDGLEVGWHVRYDRWGEGVATEAALAAADYAVRRFDTDLLVAIVLPGNTPSRRVAEKLGMTVAGEIEYAGEAHVLYLRWLRAADDAATTG